jgi:hypothetical protein
MCQQKSTGLISVSGFALSAYLATNGCLPKTLKSKGNQMQFIDYSTLLMDMERIVKQLHEKCLHKQYEGYMADIAELHSKTTLLGAWIATEQLKGRFK